MTGFRSRVRLLYRKSRGIILSEETLTVHFAKLFTGQLLPGGKMKTLSSAGLASTQKILLIMPTSMNQKIKRKEWESEVNFWMIAIPEEPQYHIGNVPKKDVAFLFKKKFTPRMAAERILHIIMPSQ